MNALIDDRMMIFITINNSYMNTLITPATSFIASMYTNGTYLITDRTACTAGLRDYPELRFDKVTAEWAKAHLDFIEIYCMN